MFTHQYFTQYVLQSYRLYKGLINMIYQLELTKIYGIYSILHSIQTASTS